MCIPSHHERVFDLDDVGTMAVSRLGLGASVTLALHGAAIKLESRVGASRAFAEALTQAKTALDHMDDM